jgi:hypothetical protein
MSWKYAWVNGSKATVTEASIGLFIEGQAFLRSYDAATWRCWALRKGDIPWHHYTGLQLMRLLLNVHHTISETSQNCEWFYRGGGGVVLARQSLEYMFGTVSGVLHCLAFIWIQLWITLLINSLDSSLGKMPACDTYEPGSTPGSDKIIVFSFGVLS